MNKIKDKTVNYFTNMSVPGIRQIALAESFVYKIIWFIMISVVFGIGFWNIYLAVDDYYKFDVITNIERVRPENLTFPAIVFCTTKDRSYKRDHYINGTKVGSEDIYLSSSNTTRIQNFLLEAGFYSQLTDSYYNLTENLSSFIQYHPSLIIECLRFNGFVPNQKINLLEASSTSDYFFIKFQKKYKQKISKKEFFNYSLTDGLDIFITDNYLNSYYKVDSFQLSFSDCKINFIDMAKESVEIKLPEPYNRCKESSAENPFYQENCMETCFFNEIKNQYNCTFQLSLFAVPGLEQCSGNYSAYIKNDFVDICLKKCSMKGCYSERFNFKIYSPNDHPNIIAYFFMDDFSSLNITQIPKTDGFTFLNNVGGGLGLFMGLAFPNFIEFCQFIAEIFMVFFV